jgi:hypothetical protein
MNTMNAPLTLTMKLGVSLLLLAALVATHLHVSNIQYRTNVTFYVDGAHSLLFRYRNDTHTYY